MHPVLSFPESQAGMGVWGAGQGGGGGYNTYKLSLLGVWRAFPTLPWRLVFLIGNLKSGEMETTPFLAYEFVT